MENLREKPVIQRMLKTGVLAENELYLVTEESLLVFTVLARLGLI